DLRLKEQQAKLQQIGGEKRNIGFGSQIRSYVLQPYQMIKDLRTRFQVGDVQRVLDGDLDEFIKTYLMQKALGKLDAEGAEDDEGPRSSRGGAEGAESAESYRISRGDAGARGGSELTRRRGGRGG